MTVVDRTVTVEVEGTDEIPGEPDLQRESADALDMDVEVRIEYAPIAVVTYSIDQGEEVQVPNMIVSPWERHQMRCFSGTAQSARNLVRCTGRTRTCRAGGTMNRLRSVAVAGEPATGHVDVASRSTVVDG